MCNKVKTQEINTEHTKKGNAKRHGKTRNQLNSCQCKIYQLIWSQSMTYKKVSHDQGVTQEASHDG